MSYLNSTLLNGDYFQAGSGLSKYIVPLGTVHVSCTASVSVQRWMNVGSGGRAFSDANLSVKRGMLVAHIARATESVLVFDTKYKTFKNAGEARVSSDAQLSHKYQLGSTQAGRADGRAVPAQIKQVRVTETVVAASEANTVLRRGCVAEGLCASASVVRGNLKVAAGIAAEASAGSDARIGVKRWMRVVADVNAEPVFSGALRIALSAEAPSYATSQTRLTKTIPYDAMIGSTGPAVAAYGRVIGKVTLRAGASATATAYANLEERDTRPAPDERQMIVPYEDRKMKVY